jgi:hypothetical protein
MTRMKALALALAVLLPALALSQEFYPSSKPISPSGTRATCDLPISQHKKNVGGSDGAGLCVYTSAWHAALWQRLEAIYAFREWMRRRPGGSWPEKFDKTLKQFCAETGVAIPDYVQHTGGDVAVLELALKTGRIVSVTYSGRDDFYRSRVAHMVNLVHLDSKEACIVDNNRPGSFVWMSREAFISRWRDMGGGWCFVFLAPPPPPYPSPPANTLSQAEADDETPPPGRVVVGQCGPGGCRIPGAAASTSKEPVGSPPSPDHEWGEIPGVGMGWRFKAVNAEPLTGVVEEQISAVTSYRINGQESTREGVFGAIAGLADDSDRWSLVAVGDPGFQRRVMDDVARLPADVRSKLHVVPYTPITDWQPEQFGLIAGVTLRKPAGALRIGPDVGRVPAAEYLSTRLTALLEATGGPAPPPSPSPDPASPAKPQSPWMFYAALIVALVTALRRKP